MDKDRPSGWEFPNCERCNQLSRGADALGQILALSEPVSDSLWKIKQIEKSFAALKKYAPKVAAELSSARTEKILVRWSDRVNDSVKMQVDGPATIAHLNIFAAKMAMATFAEIVKRPIEENGLIYSQCFLNAGLSLESYETIVGIMPGFEQLKQGTKVSGKQFSLRYNSDHNSIVAAIISLHSCLNILIIITDNSDLLEPLRELLKKSTGSISVGSQITTPGLKEIGSGFSADGFLGR